MYAGRIVEQGTIADLFSEPRHPYTRGLFDAIPTLDGPRKRLVPITGTVPNPRDLPAGCSFYPRCSRGVEECRSRLPQLQVQGDGRQMACHRPVAAAPKSLYQTRILEAV
jgi:peptide/nickel transport system ATP-binding protein